MFLSRTFQMGPKSLSSSLRLASSPHLHSLLTFNMDLRIIHLYRQYLQQLDELSFPPPTVLIEPSVQNEIFQNFFDSSNGQPLPPLQYQRRVLKEITDRILSAIRDPDEDVCFSLWLVLFRTLPTDTVSSFLQFCSA